MELIHGVLQMMCSDIVYPTVFFLRSIPGTGSLKVTVETTGCSDNTKKVRYLEHVQVVLTLLCSRRGDLSIKLISPSGTPAILLPPRKNDYSSSGFTDWEFMSTHTWGEDPRGIWTLEIKNHGKGMLQKVLYLTPRSVENGRPVSQARGLCLNIQPPNRSGILYKQIRKCLNAAKIINFLAKVLSENGNSLDHVSKLLPQKVFVLGSPTHQKTPAYFYTSLKNFGS